MCPTYPQVFISNSSYGLFSLFHCWSSDLPVCFLPLFPIIGKRFDLGLFSYCYVYNRPTCRSGYNQAASLQLSTHHTQRANIPKTTWQSTFVSCLVSAFFSVSIKIFGCSSEGQTKILRRFAGVTTCYRRAFVCPMKLSVVVSGYSCGIGYTELNLGIMPYCMVILLMRICIALLCLIWFVCRSNCAKHATRGDRFPSVVVL
jgi:hypothetical protein